VVLPVFLLLKLRSGCQRLVVTAVAVAMGDSSVQSWLSASPAPDLRSLDAQGRRGVGQLKLNVLKSAAAALGKIEESHETTRYLILKARYGLNPVRLRVSVQSGPTSDRAILEIEGRGQDVWGVASRKVIDRLCAAF
jgi:hypothetical protein